MEELDLPQMTLLDYIGLYLFNPASLLLIAGAALLLLNKYGSKRLPKWGVVIAWICAGIGASLWAALLFFMMMFSAENKRFGAMAPPPHVTVKSA